MKKFNYGFLEKLGFKRQEENDPNFFAERGYQYFLFTLKLCKGVQMDWNSETGFVTVYRKIDECSYTKLSVYSEKQLLEYIEFFKRKTKRTRDSYY
jgi:hypothetical protein